MKLTAFARTLPLAALLLTACRESGVTTYRIPKEKTAAAPAFANATVATAPDAHSAPNAAGAAMADSTVATATGASLVWSAPTHWVAKPASAMRRGNYAITGGDGTTAELAITAFPGDVGGEVANLNRWRGQLQLAPQDAAQLAGSVTRLEANGLRITLVDLAGPAGANGAVTRLLGAMVPYGGNTWFFKLLGPDALVAPERAAFTAFLQTVKPAAP